MLNNRDDGSSEESSENPHRNMHMFNNRDDGSSEDHDEGHSMAHNVHDTHQYRGGHLVRPQYGGYGYDARNGNWASYASNGKEYGGVTAPINKNAEVISKKENGTHTNHAAHANGTAHANSTASKNDTSHTGPMKGTTHAKGSAAAKDSADTKKPQLFGRFASGENAASKAANATTEHEMARVDDTAFNPEADLTRVDDTAFNPDAALTSFVDTGFNPEAAFASSDDTPFNPKVAKILNSIKDEADTAIAENDTTNSSTSEAAKTDTEIGVDGKWKSHIDHWMNVSRVIVKLINYYAGVKLQNNAFVL
ncbi:Hypothetical predicted protein [Octopus vulgaris]|uniref:Uncharacterized protein n=1 Tax=Octopus vulgaris TaxID=6645 RepID=A0AA36F281_OCTVU|nr:Hypothetical predicted protein [Octopus vulgaris]